MAQQSHSINPNSDKYYIDNRINLSIDNHFPKFIKKLDIENLKQISNLQLEFKHPISIISGVNRSGKTTILTTIACSHELFKKKNITTGQLERHTWQDFMKFTANDMQSTDYEFSITYKTGGRIDTKFGKRNQNTKKWSGVAKKEGQIKDREVRYIDLSRLLPARNFGKPILTRRNNSTINQKLTTYLSHILEIQFCIQAQFSHQDKETFSYQRLYSSFNAATGEETLVRLLKEIIDAPTNSIILIDEIEAGLHPKIQRRLMDIIYHIARYENKQFIITSHSPVILSCVPNKSRIFIENKSGTYISHQDKSINFILSKMDSIMYPLIDLFCEDKVAKRALNKLLDELKNSDTAYNNIINIIEIGAASETFNTFKAFKNTFSQRKIKTGYGCILDADMKFSTEYQNNAPFIYFLFGEYTNTNPEKFLVEQYLTENPHEQLQYYLQQANNHVLFKNMFEFGIVNSDSDDYLASFHECWSVFIRRNPDYLESFKNYIDTLILHFTTNNL